MEKKLSIIINIVFYSLILGLVLAFATYILPVLVPFIIAFIVASFLQVFVRKLSKWRPDRKRSISILLCILFYILVAILISFVGIKIVDIIWSFIESIPGLFHQTIVPVFSQLAGKLNELLTSSDIGIAGEVNMLFQEMMSAMENFITTFSVNAVKIATGGVVGIPGFIIKAVITVVATFFFVADYDKILEFMGKLIPKDKEESFHNIKNYFASTLLIYLRSYSLLFLITYVELSIGFSIFKIPYALLIALLVAIFDILPILGVGGILLPWAVILVFMQEIPLAIGMAALYLVITIIRNTLEPRVVGKQIGLHPLATLIALYVGLKVLGIIGMFLFPVTLAVLVNMEKEDALHIVKKQENL
ncbi:MAG: sporulation integral membrane protein YtvI [Lachnospiraceae bacterium]|nr:sporulation integral membrane protein YtvI [Lachnospiraceae bacterium]